MSLLVLDFLGVCHYVHLFISDFANQMFSVCLLINLDKDFLSYWFSQKTQFCYFILFIALFISTLLNLAPSFTITMYSSSLCQSYWFFSWNEFFVLSILHNIFCLFFIDFGPYFEYLLLCISFSYDFLFCDLQFSLCC